MIKTVSIAKPFKAWIKGINHMALAKVIDWAKAHLSVFSYPRLKRRGNTIKKTDSQAAKFIFATSYRSPQSPNEPNDERIATQQAMP